MRKDQEMIEFVESWMMAYKIGQTKFWVAEYLNISYKKVHNRCGYLRGRGVKLPNLHKRSDLVVQELNELIKELL